jgi:hypothetical protein
VAIENNKKIEEEEEERRKKVNYSTDFICIDKKPTAADQPNKRIGKRPQDYTQ